MSYKKCQHNNVKVEQPCCSMPDSNGNFSCGCEGQISIWCPYCLNEDMTREDIDRIILNDNQEGSDGEES